MPPTGSNPSDRFGSGHTDNAPPHRGRRLLFLALHVSSCSFFLVIRPIPPRMFKPALLLESWLEVGRFGKRTSVPKTRL
jgi:hypothetical protein